MSRESKILQAGVWSAEKTVYHYESFGWELLSLNGNQITMSRETQNPVYTDLVKYQAKYEQLVQDYKNVRDPQQPVKPANFQFGKCCLLLVMFVVPGALYIGYKINQYNKYKEKMVAYEQQLKECQDKRAKISAEIEQLLSDSRATFFGKQ